MYETVAMEAADFAWITVRFRWLNQGWECRRPADGVVYLRRYVSCARNTDAGWEGWSVIVHQ